MTITQCLYNR
uniref:Uncharacterized protein n=1 Tax=Anguilla anguilla TaxID=7936 RepID=A0A0E9T416_ANGAN